MVSGLLPEGDKYHVGMYWPHRLSCMQPQLSYACTPAGADHIGCSILRWRRARRRWWPLPQRGWP